MGYTNRTSGKRWGLPLGLVALILVLVLYGGLSGPVPAHAVAITCGGCHHVPPDATDSACRTPAKNHAAHSNGNVAATNNACIRCHTAAPEQVVGHPSGTHNNALVNVTCMDAASPGLRYVKATTTCTYTCHKNQASAIWGGAATCNMCHFRSGAIGSVTPTGLHVDAARAYKHFSSAIKVTDNTKTMTCINCHPANDNDTVAPRSHIASTTGTAAGFAARANLSAAFANVTVIGVGYTKGGSQGTGACAKSCHYNGSDPYTNYTVLYKSGTTQKKRSGAYVTSKWNDTDLRCNDCHSTPSTKGTFLNATSNAYGNNTAVSGNARTRHRNHMLRYKLNQNVLTDKDKNIYCDDCHRTPDITLVRGFNNHSTLGEGGSKKISLPVKSQNARVYLLRRNGGKGQDGINPPAFNTAKGNCSNIYCHTAITKAAFWAEPACNSCHGKKDGVDVGSGAPGYRNWSTSPAYSAFEDYTGGGGAHYTHVQKHGYVCRTCHFDAGDSNPANHNQGGGIIRRTNVSVAIQSTWNFKGVGATYNKSTRLCSNVKCHYGTSKNWDCSPAH